MTRSGRCVYHTAGATAAWGDIDWYASAGSGERPPAVTADWCAAERRWLAKIKTTEPNRCEDVLCGSVGTITDCLRCDVPEEKIWEFIYYNKIYKIYYIIIIIVIIFILLLILLQPCSLLRRQSCKLTSVVVIQLSALHLNAAG